MIERDDKNPQLCYHQTPSAGHILDAYCYMMVVGPWVRIRKDRFYPPVDALTLCEVIITGTRIGMLSLLNAS